MEFFGIPEKEAGPEPEIKSECTAKDGERFDIGGVSAPVILAMVGLNFVRTALWAVLYFMIWPMLCL